MIIWGGGTNTDLLRGLILAILDHPDGFFGEVDRDRRRGAHLLLMASALGRRGIPTTRCYGRKGQGQKSQ